MGLSLGYAQASVDISDDLHFWLKTNRANIPFSDTEMEKALAAGKTLDLDTVVEELLQELKAYLANP